MRKFTKSLIIYTLVFAVVLGVALMYRGMSQADTRRIAFSTMTEYLEAGKIINTFGIRGEVKLQPWCDSAEFLRPFKTLYIDGAPRAVASSRVHKGMLIVRFAGVEDMDAAEALRMSGLADVVIEAAKKGTPLLGICLGMQLLFDESYEYGLHPGLGLIPGQVRAISERIPSELKIPHIGWNALHFTEKKSALFRDVKENDCVYFVHSYFASDCAPDVIATAEYGAELTAAVADGNVYGCQFHPEKSGEVGMKILRAFCEL